MSYQESGSSLTSTLYLRRWQEMMDSCLHWLGSLHRAGFRLCGTLTESYNRKYWRNLTGPYLTIWERTSADGILPKSYDCQVLETSNIRIRHRLHYCGRNRLGSMTHERSGLSFVPVYLERDCPPVMIYKMPDPCLQRSGLCFVLHPALWSKVSDHLNSGELNAFLQRLDGEMMLSSQSSQIAPGISGG